MREPHHAQRRAEHDGGAVAAVALAAAALTVAGVLLVLPTARAARVPARAGERPTAAAALSAPSTAAAAAPGAAPAGPPAVPPVPAAPAVPAVPAPLDLGACLRTGVDDVTTAQADLDAGCTVALAYGPAPWLAAHDHDAGDAWKAMPDGAEFSYAGHAYRVVDRTHLAYVAGPVALDPLVHGDLTLQTCDGVDELVFLHAALLG